MSGRVNLLRVVAPRFVAGALFQNRYCFKAAPIIKWMIGKTWSDIQHLADDSLCFEWVRNEVVGSTVTIARARDGINVG